MQHGFLSVLGYRTGSIVRSQAEIGKKGSALGQNLKGGFNLCPEDDPACRERRFVR